VLRWIVYETRNLKNDKRYVGVHLQDRDEFDGYLGSGSALLAAIAKYGKDGFERRTLHVCGSLEEAYAKEREIVNDEWVASSETYNLKHGGLGGVGYKHTEKTRRLISQKRAGRKHSEETRRKISEAGIDRRRDPAVRKRISDAMKIANLGRVHSPETRQRISNSMKAAWKEGRRGAS
jgi:group I intron endonuclease